MVLALSTPFGLGEEERNRARGELGAWFSVPPNALPDQLGELCTATSVFAGIAAALKPGSDMTSRQKK